MTARAAADPFPAGFRDLLRALLAQRRTTVAADDRRTRAVRRQFGRSGTFAGHRPHAAGDDARDVDWNAYARTGELAVKVFEEDERRAMTLLVDRSASMQVGQTPRLLWAQRFAAVLGALGLKRQAAVRVIGVGRAVAEPLQGVAAVPALLERLHGGADLEPLQAVRPELRAGGGGRLVWLSDFACPEAVEPVLAALRAGGRECLGVLPEIEDDRLPPAASGLVRVHDPETGARVSVRVDDQLRAHLGDELRRLHRAQDVLFARHGAALLRLPAPADPGDFSLATWHRTLAAVEARRGWR